MKFGFKIKDNRKLVKWVWIVIFSPVLIILLSLLMVGIFADIPSFEELEDPKSNLATQIIAEDGTVLSTFHIENRSYASYNELSDGLKDALIATEDVRFYNHSGIDFRSLARVVVKSVLMGNRRSGGGGSTISQQLAKSLFPRDTVESKFPGAKYFVLVNNKHNLVIAVRPCAVHNLILVKDKVIDWCAVFARKHFLPKLHTAHRTHR